MDEGKSFRNAHGMLESRHDQLTERFFQRSVLTETALLLLLLKRYLLPDLQQAGTARHYRVNKKPKAQYENIYFTMQW